MPLILRPPSSQESLTESLRSLGRTRRALAVSAAILRLATVLVGTILLAGLLDAAVKLPPLARGGLLVAILAWTGLVVVRALRPALRLPTGSLAVALDLEAHFPRMNDALGSAVSFLADEEQGLASHGSPRMKRSAITRARRLSDRYNFRELLGSGRFWKMFWCAAGVGLAAVALALLFPRESRVASVRLADPFGHHPWPARTRVAVILPELFPARTAIGDRFEIGFELHGEIPPEAIIHIRLQSGGGFTKVVELPPEEAEPPEYRYAEVALDGSQVTGSFSFQVTANDGDSGWQSVIAAPPPKLVPRDGRASPQIHAEFPEYTRLPAIDLSDGVGVIDAPVGTTFTLRAAADLDLRSATLVYLGDRSAVDRASPAVPIGILNPLGALGSRILAASLEQSIPIAIGPDRRTLDAVVRPSLSGLYGLRMTDDTGLTGTRLMEFRLQSDPSPNVTLDRPTASHDPDVFAPDVALNFATTAEDRLFAVRRSYLEYRFSKDEPYREVALHDGVACQVAAPALGGGWLAALDPLPTRIENRRTVPIARFTHADGKPPRAGDTLFVRAAADDWDDVRPLKPHGHSAEIELRIADREGVDAFLQKELTEMRRAILQARNQQHEARTLTGDAAPEADGSLDSKKREKLLNAEQLQKQIEGKVADARDGLRAKADRLLATARLNRLPPGNTRARLEAVADALGRLADRELGTIEPLLGEARQIGAAPRSGSAATVADLLARAGLRQQTVEETFNSLLGQLEQWGSAGEIAGEARGLRDAIENQSNRTGELRARVPDGGPPEYLRPAQRQELEKAAGKLDQLAEQSGRLLTRAGRFAEERQARAAEATAKAAEKDAEAKQARDDAAATTSGSEEERAAKARADAASGEAEALRQSAAQAHAEEESLRAAVQAAGGQSLPEDLRRAAAAVRANQTGKAETIQHQAVERLSALGQALVEPSPPEAVPDALSRKNSADRLDTLAEDQDELRKKVRDAAAIPDPAARSQELQKLSREQERLRQQAQDELQKLTRRRGEDAARDLRAAVDQMEAARDDLERGHVPAQPQGDAIDRLEKARDRLDRDAQPNPGELTRENRRKLADLVRALRDRQAEAVTEAERITAESLRQRNWPRPLQASLDDLAARERTLAEDVRSQTAKNFEDHPIIRRLLEEAADAMTLAGSRISDRLEDIITAGANFDPPVETAAAARFRTPMSLALRRFDQLLDALPDEKTPDPQAQENPDQAEPMGQPGDDSQLIPPLAQLKILRSLQAELNERTAAFAEAHPETQKLSDDEKDELKALETAQREIAALFQEIAEMVPMQSEAP